MAALVFDRQEFVTVPNVFDFRAFQYSQCGLNSRFLDSFDTMIAVVVIGGPMVRIACKVARKRNMGFPFHVSNKVVLKHLSKPQVD